MEDGKRFLRRNKKSMIRLFYLHSGRDLGQIMELSSLTGKVVEDDDGEKTSKETL